MSELGTKLKSALEADLNNYIWKGEKRTTDNGRYEQESVRLMDATPEQLNKFYRHCYTMLFNTSKQRPGRMTLLKMIDDQKDRCGVELLFRHLRSKGVSQFAIVESLRSAISNSALTKDEVDQLVLGDLMQIDSDFTSLPASLVIAGGIDQLGWFDRSHLTLAFILRQGVWFSESERKELSKILTYSTRERLDMLKRTLRIPEGMNLEFNSDTGLSIKEMTAMLTLQSKRYRDLTTDQLETLRYKVLFNLEDQVNVHISQWSERMQQIKLVAKHRDIVIEKNSSI